MWHILKHEIMQIAVLYSAFFTTRFMWHILKHEMMQIAVLYPAFFTTHCGDSVALVFGYLSQGLRI